MLDGGAGTIEQCINCVVRSGVVVVCGFLSQLEKLCHVAGLVLAKGAIVRCITVNAKQMIEDMLRLVCSKSPPIIDEETSWFDEKSIRSLRLINTYLESASHVGIIAIEVH